MNDKVTYLILNAKLNAFSKNIDLILSNLNNFDKICSSTLIFNGSANYKNDVVNIKWDLNNQKDTLNKKIIEEIKQNLLN